MGSRSSISVVIFLVVNICFTGIITACSDHPPPPPPPPKPNCAPPTTAPPPPKPKSTPPPQPQSYPTPPLHTPPSTYQKCPRNTLKLGVCGNLLGGLASFSIPTPRNYPCCNLIQDLVDLEAAVCLCTAIKAHVLHIINLDVEVSLTLILNNCGRKLPHGFQCAY